MIELLENRRLLTFVQADTSFGDGGVARFEPSPDIFNVVEQLPNGKILAAGGTLSYYAVVAHFNADGSPDKTFDGDGAITVYDGGLFHQATLAPDGKIVIITDLDSYASGGDAQLRFHRFNADGTIDNSFGTKGEVILSISSANIANGRGVAVQPDGKIVFTYSAGKNVSEVKSGLLRLKADGTIDNTFRGGLAAPLPTDLEYHQDVLAAADGSIYLSGGYKFSKDFTSAVVERYKPNGTLDTSYGTDGRSSIVDISGGLKNVYPASIEGIDLDKSGRIVARANSLTRFNTDGSRDETFNYDANPSGGASPDALTFGPSNKITGAVGFISNQVRLFRLNDDGSADKSFGINGRVDFAKDLLEIQSLTIDKQGRVLAAGQTHEPYYLAAARFVEISADVFLDDAGELFINGSDDADTISLEQSGTKLIVHRNSKDTSYNFADVKSLTLMAGAGGDAISVPFGLECNIDGGTGNDTISVGDGDETINGGSGNDRITCGEGAHRIDLGKGNDRLATGLGRDTVTGGSGNDIILTGDDVDSIDSGDGDDSIACGDGNDTIYTGEGNDTVHAGPGDDKVRASANGDVEGDKTYFGEDGDDLMYGGSGRDTLMGGGENDTLVGGMRSDLLIGGGGNDSLRGSGGPDRLHGGDGRDRLRGEAGDDLLYGEASGDFLYGGSRNDSLEGDGGDDQLFGDDGADTLHGNAGNDSFYTSADKAIDQLFGDGGRDSADADKIDALTSIESTG